MFQARIFVRLKPNVLDPQGKAVSNTLRQLGYANVVETRVSKYIEITFATDDEEAARLDTEKICNDLLANPNTEHYSFTLEALEAGQA